MFQQGDVACHQRGREKTEHLPKGKVPRHHSKYDAERVPAHVAVIIVGWNGFGREDAGSVVSVVAADVGTLQDLESGGSKWLAHLECDQGGEVLGLMLQNGGELAHAQGAMLQRN